jgi:hypothetical protein
MNCINSIWIGFVAIIKSMGYPVNRKGVNRIFDQNLQAEYCLLQENEN